MDRNLGHMLILLAVTTVHGAITSFTATPTVIEPGTTPSITLRCSVSELETGNVQSIALYRRVIKQRPDATFPDQFIAELRQSAPFSPVVAKELVNVTATGQILPAQLETETELGSYLEITWLSPQVEDLGRYSCEVTAPGETGAVIYLGETIITTSQSLDVTVDRILVRLLGLENKIRHLNRTVTEVQAELDNITSEQAQVELSPDTTLEPATTTTLEPATTTTRTTTTSLPTTTTATYKETPKEEITTTTTTTTTTASATSAAELDGPTTSLPPTPEEATTVAPLVPVSEIQVEKLAEVVDQLDEKFDEFNRTLARLDQLISLLEQDRADKFEDTARNITETEPAVADIIRDYFPAGNSSYFLFQSNRNTDFFRAQSICESKRLNLADIVDEEELDSVSVNILTFIPEDEPVLIGGQQIGGQDWVYQGSGQPVTFVLWGSEADQEPGDCLALQKTSNETLVMVALPCTRDLTAAFFLCEKQDI